jgi:hypothetical protein
VWATGEAAIQQDIIIRVPGYVCGRLLRLVANFGSAGGCILLADTLVEPVPQWSLYFCSANSL